VNNKLEMNKLEIIFWKVSTEKYNYWKINYSPEMEKIVIISWK